MSTLSKLVDPSILGVQSLLQQAQKDDFAFLALIILTGIFYNVYIKEKPDPYHHVWFERPQATDANAKGADTRDIGVKLEESKKDLVIFWGSQSGTAEGFANRLVRDCRSRFGLDALAADLSDYDPESISNIPETKFAIFIISTYGEGDPSDNATQFLSWLDANKTVHFPKLSYAAFGLGNKKYKFYNKVVDVVVEALDRSGAKSLMPVGKADDSNGTTEEDFTEWKQSLFALFRGTLGFQERPAQYEPTLKVIEDTSLDIIDLHVGEPIKPKSTKKSSSQSSAIHSLPVKDARKLLQTKERNCLHLEIDIHEFPELKYKTGDHLTVWPCNPSSEIQLLVNALGLQGKTDTPLLIQSIETGVKVKVPSPTTWQALLQHYLEISGPVPREIVLSLSHFAPDSASKATLTQLGENKDAYHEYCLQNHVTFGRLLAALNSGPGAWSSIPLSFILESLPLLSPRYYSISSSSIVSPKTISITVATSSELTPNQTFSIPGLTTTYLSSLTTHLSLSPPPSPQNQTQEFIHDQPPKLYTSILTSKFRLPTLPSHPIILIASGSGLAPFLGFLAERQRLASIGRNVGKSILFFGCRGSSDYIYKSELEKLVEGSGGGIEVVTAFSREGGKKYVQDRVEEREEEVCRLLGEENAYFYVCGSAAMARDVKARVEGVIGRRRGWGEEEVRGWSEGLRRGKRWQEDVWG
ncbi:riboflavin synthase domain-like protein [Hyaloscypha variabilis F]|uniref:NADPH--cytochrome P450 reductase n=1 Tax=Hyaloscypha variabilis (strain UAMH 11265 / GT02V1 / F) TaxID=1149755 RepID=A0A2J6RJ93_HYAVF|nr:riboflavin synthase domain-like protein [Hyaloscypha variabilis F]